MITHTNKMMHIIMQQHLTDRPYYEVLGFMLHYYYEKVDNGIV